MQMADDRRLHSPRIDKGPLARVSGLGRSSRREGRRGEYRFSSTGQRQNSCHNSHIWRPSVGLLGSPGIRKRRDWGRHHSIYWRKGARDFLNGYEAFQGPFSPGYLIRVPHFEQHALPELQGNRNGDKGRLESEQYGAICAKWRKMVVVAVHQLHYVCLPIFTFNGRGLSADDGRMKRDPEEFVSIFDHRVQRELRAQTHHEPLRTAFLKHDVKILHPESVVQLTYPVARRNYCLSIVEGYLDKDSTDRLKKHYAKKNTTAWVMAMNDELQYGNEYGMADELPDHVIELT